MTTLFNPLRVLVRHQDPLLAAGLNAALEAAPGIEIVATSDHAPIPDAGVLVGDYETGVAWVRHWRRTGSTMKQAPGVVIVTWRDSEADVRAALQLGIGGYLLGNCGLNELIEAVRCVDRGSPYLCEIAATRVAKSLTRPPLTMRETEILQLMASGMPNKLIASQLSIALGTVKAHAKAILDKLGASSRTQATVIAAQRGLLSAHSPLRPASEHPRQRTSSALLQSKHEGDRIGA